MTARPATLLLLASVFLLIPTKHSRALKEVDGACKATPEGGAVETRIAHEAVTVALVELHDALIALETI